MIRKFAILATPILLIALLEMCFQLGLWEPFAARYSHAGISIALKRKLLAPSLQSIDYVTLGSSRPLYGLDHASLAALAKQHDRVHANLSIAGSHWMTIGVIGRWLHQHHPELRGGIVALSIEDFASAGNGPYELGIVQPFRRIGDFSLIDEHVPFNLGDPESFGVYSTLFGWRKDIQDFLAHPSRIKSFQKYAEEDRSSNSLFEDLESKGDMCNQELHREDPCSSLQKPADASIDLKQQCNQILTVRKYLPDFSQVLSSEVIPDALQATRSSIRARLRNLDWSIPPLMILMPDPEFSRSPAEAAGLHQWTREILRPLVDANEIHLIDATDFLANTGTDECHYFFDFYHQNAAGRELLNQWLRPQIETWLYSAEARH